MINWQKGYITATGKTSFNIKEKGVPADSYTGTEISINRARKEAYLAARVEAVEAIVRAIKSVRVDPEKNVDDLLNENHFTQKMLSEKLLEEVTVKEYPSDFFSSMCEVRLNFIDIITALPYVFPANDFPVIDNNPITTYYSSLIIDARGLDVKPMLLPSVYSEGGLEIYGSQFIEGTRLLNGGMISYCHTEDEAMKNKRAGDVPYFTVALKSIRGCPVISAKAARKILGHTGTVGNLKNCRVIFIINRM
ncbi:MAG: hypothetical protein MUC95_10240 [Spirochaetes bacterium]|nr:hypothetical protein [Spirochaetota bacterium]